MNLLVTSYRSTTTWYSISGATSVQRRRAVPAFVQVWSHVGALPSGHEPIDCAVSIGVVALLSGGMVGVTELGLNSVAGLDAPQPAASAQRHAVIAHLISLIGVRLLSIPIAETKVKRYATH
jgi:hypothetical protein